LSMAQVELKEELKMKQGTYIAEVHSRLRYQKTMMNIVDIIQEKCTNHQLVEQVLALSDECESDYMNGPTGVDFTPTKKRQANGISISSPSINVQGAQSLAGRFKSFLFSD